MPVREFSVLVVEDNPGDFKLLQTALNDISGYEFHLQHVERLDNAFRKLDSNPADVVLLDLHLPDSQGLDTLDRLHAAYPRVPIIVYSTTSESQTITDALNRGAKEYVVKDRLDGLILAEGIVTAVARNRARTSPPPDR